MGVVEGWWWLRGWLWRSSEACALVCVVMLARVVVARRGGAGACVCRAWFVDVVWRSEFFAVGRGRWGWVVGRGRGRGVWFGLGCVWCVWWMGVFCELSSCEAVRGGARVGGRHGG